MGSIEIIHILAIHVFSYMFLGFLLAGFGVLSSGAIQFLLKKITVNILFPCLIIEKILRNLSYSDKTSALVMFFSALIMIFGSWGIAWIWVPAAAGDGETKKAMYICNVFHNYGFMAYPLISALLGAKSLALVFIFAVTCDGLLWSFGIYLLKQGSQSKFSLRQILSPPALAVLLATPAALFGLGQSVPGTLLNILGYPGIAAVPLAIFCSGGIVYHAFTAPDGAPSGQRQVFLSLISRLAFLPLLWFTLITLIVPWQDLQRILYIQAIMPSSVVIVAMVTLYGGNRRYAAMFSVLSILFSVVTIPVYLKLFF